jgi:UDP-3-O-[3-hydroxymyristoyl] glucosamine N-acyltransferase
MTLQVRLTLAELAVVAKAQLVGDRDCAIFGVDTLTEAEAGSIAFLANPRYRRYLQSTRASAVILRKEDYGHCPTNALISGNPYLAFARVTVALYPEAPISAGIHPSAVVDRNAQVDPSASVGANSVIDAEAEVGPGCEIGPLCFIGRGAKLGADTRLVANVTVCARSKIGARCRLQPGVVIGSDGFGLANDAGTWVRVPQTGRVCLGDDVDVGANTTIDRGAIRDTLIADGVKLDNLIQLAHNVEVGAHTAMAACTGISGSSRIGRNCTLAGAVGVVGHVEIGDDVHVSGMSMVSRSIRDPGVYTGSIPAMPHAEWRRNFARLKQLDDMARRLRRLESQLAPHADDRED